MRHHGNNCEVDDVLKTSETTWISNVRFIIKKLYSRELILHRVPLKVSALVPFLNNVAAGSVV
jgi:hypothetical protein